MILDKTMLCCLRYFSESQKSQPCLWLFCLASNIWSDVGQADGRSHITMTAELWWELEEGDCPGTALSHPIAMYAWRWSFPGAFFSHVHLVIVSARERTGEGYVWEQTQFLPGTPFEYVHQGTKLQVYVSFHKLFQMQFLLKKCTELIELGAWQIPSPGSPECSRH